MGQDRPRGRRRARPACVGRCEHCGRRSYRKADSCGRRTCPGYVDTWLGDTRRKYAENLGAFGGDVVMTTITGPGAADGLLWDEAACAHRGPHRHAGKDGCRVRGDLAEWFNRSAADRLSRLHKAAYQRTVRKVGYRRLVRLAYAPELHERGVIHWHVVLAAGTAAERHAAGYYVAQLSDLAPLYGYGFVDRGQRERGRARALRPVPAGVAAAYISKYLTKTDRGGLRELVLTGLAPPRVAYVARRLTDETRCTMRTLRRRRYVYAVWRTPMSCRAVDSLWRLVETFDAELEPVEPEPATAPAASP